MVQYAEDHFGVIESKTEPPPSVKAGRYPYGQGADGYGSKIATNYLVRLDRRGPWRRVYCTCFSNCGTVWVSAKGKRYCFRHDENLRLLGEWPK